VPASADPDPLAALESLLRQAGPLLRAARARNRHGGNGRPVGEAAGTGDRMEALIALIAATRAELAAVRGEIAALRAELAARTSGGADEQRAGVPPSVQNARR
ncbi:MAG TPA: hypothetical protein VHF26_21090, partial [Trebonia sp.]|nr:hypothetical protein [Trebonia sp.]